jgi:hypothetical protein
MIRLLLRLAVLAGAIALVKKALDSRSAPAPAPAPQPAEPVRATPPPDAPGPSVSAAGPPASETERAKKAERTVSDPAPDDDPLVAEEEAAAAAEAAGIGGPGVHDADDPAFEAAYEAGGGESEGFELAEEELVDNASHGGGRADPIRDAFTPEVEADEATAVDGEADEVIEADEDRR